MKKRIAILGSTGSIGKQTLEIIEMFSDKFQVEVLTSLNNAELLINQAKKFNPNAVVIVNEDKYNYVESQLKGLNIKVFTGKESLNSIVEMSTIDLVIVALVGIAGLQPTINAIEANKNIALANKETLVVAGKLIKSLITNKNIAFLPIDSEHSAIFQCIVGEQHKNIHKLILTASGGPFFGKNSTFLNNVSPEQALKHPNWKMGNKVTIDSSTLMNKGLEVIEAHWLFDIPIDNIDVVVHPQSIIHSFVQFCDGSIKAQLSNPDMRLPILYAMTFPDRFKTDLTNFDFTKMQNLTFHNADNNLFECLQIAYNSIIKGGNVPCIMNAANEIAVNAFINKKIKFFDIAKTIKHTIDTISFVSSPTLNEYFEADNNARKIAEKFINNINH